MIMEKENRYTIEVTEHQLRLISQCVEDCHRFMAGQMELCNMMSLLPNYRELRNQLSNLQPLVTPRLYVGSFYKWSGGDCPNELQRKFIAETYCIYREILHQLTVRNSDIKDSVYNEKTLTCEESGPLPIIHQVQ